MADFVEDNSDRDATTRYFCHHCHIEVTPDFENFTCPQCTSGFIEEITDDFQTNSGGADEPVQSAFMDGNIHDMLLHSLFPMQHPFFPGGSGNGNSSSSGGGTASSSSRSSANAMQDVEDLELEVELDDDDDDLVMPVRPPRRRSTRGVTNRVTRSRGAQPRRRFHQIHHTPGFHIVSGASSGAGLEGLVQQLLSNLLGEASQNGQLMQLHGEPGDYAWGPGGFDNIITQLMNQLDSTGPPPASQQQLDTLPNVVISKAMIADKVQCAVCFDEFNLEEVNVRQLPCQHIYHMECVIPWLKMHGTCPVCRKTLDGRDTTTVEEFPSTTDNETASESTAAQNSVVTTSQSSNSVQNTASINSSPVGATAPTVMTHIRAQSRHSGPSRIFRMTTQQAQASRPPPSSSDNFFDDEID